MPQKLAGSECVKQSRNQFISYFLILNKNFLMYAYVLLLIILFNVPGTNMY